MIDMREIEVSDKLPVTLVLTSLNKFWADARIFYYRNNEDIEFRLAGIIYFKDIPMTVKGFTLTVTFMSGWSKH